MANFFRSILLRLQNKTVTAGTSASSFTKDSGYDGLGTVTVNPTPSETKTQAAGTSNIDVTPSSGKLLSKVTITPTPTETKSATPSTSAQTITPSSGKYLSSVSVGAISTETKTQAAGTSNIDVTPTSGKYLTKVTVTPQQHSGYYPSSSTNVTSNGTKDLGASHNYRYVNVNVPNPTLSGDATAAYVYPGKTFYNNSYTKQTGIMTTKAADTYNTSTTDQIISSGQYLSGNQTIKAVTTFGITADNIRDDIIVRVGDANNGARIANVTGTFTDASTVSSGQTAAAAAQIRSGYSAWVDGAEVKGSIANQAAATYNTSSSDQTIASGKYISGTQTIKAVTTSGISAGNIKTGVTVKVGDANSATRIANVTGTFTAANTVSSGQTAAAAAQIKSGYSAWVGGAEVKGSYTEPTITSITPSNSSPVSMSANSNYKPSADGYAISSYKSITPSNAGPSTLASGFIYKMGGNGYAISNYSSITPSDSSPVSLTSGSIYKMSGAGKAVASVTNVTPSTGGTYFPSGIVKMSENGYAYSQRPYVVYNYTTLWENSNPGVNFSAQSVSLSQSMADFSFLLVEFYGHKNTYINNHYESSYPQEYLTVFIDKFEFISKTNSNVARKIWPCVLSSGSTSISSHYVRAMKYESDTTIYFTNATGVGNVTSSANDVAIPFRIKGLNLEINT